MPRSRSRFQQKIYMNNIFSEVLYLISSTGNAPAFHLDAHKIQIYPAPAIAQPRCLWLCSATTIRTIKKKKKRISVELTLTYTHTSAALAYTLTREYTQPPRVKQQKKKKARAQTHKDALRNMVFCSAAESHVSYVQLFTYTYAAACAQPPSTDKTECIAMLAVYVYMYCCLHFFSSLVLCSIALCALCYVSVCVFAVSIWLWRVTALHVCALRLCPCCILSLWHRFEQK